MLKVNFINRELYCIIFILFIFSILSAQAPEPIKFKANKIEYIYKKGKERVICRGNAKVERSDFYLRAVTIHIIGKDRNYAKAYKNVKILNKRDNIVVYGDYAEYDNITGYAKVFKSPKLIYTNEKLVITSSVMETYINDSKSIALGDVKITQTNYTAFSEKAVYLQNKDLIELTGDPVVYEDNNMFEAEKIVVYIKKNLIKLYDNVIAKIKSERRTVQTESSTNIGNKMEKK